MEAPVLPEAFWNHPALRAARAARDMGRVSLAYRNHPHQRAQFRRAVPQEWVAAWVGVSQVQVSRIERGECRVRELDKLLAWAKALHMPASFAWFELPDEEESADVVPPRIEGAGGDDPEAALGAHQRARDALPPLTIASAVHADLRLIRGRPALRARYAVYLGWLMHEVGDTRRAIYWTDRATEAALVAEDAALVAYVLVRKADLAGDVAGALAFARAALAQGAGRLPPMLHALAKLHEARGLASQRQTNAALAAFAEGTKLYFGDHSDGGEPWRFCTGQLSVYAADCLTRVGLTAAAIDICEKQIRGPEWLRGRGLAQLALARAKAHDPRGAAKAGLEALKVAAATGRSPRRWDLHRLGAELANKPGSARFLTNLETALSRAAGKAEKTEAN